MKAGTCKSVYIQIWLCKINIKAIVFGQNLKFWKLYLYYESDKFFLLKRQPSVVVYGRRT